MPMYGREIDECGEPTGYGHLRHICPSTSELLSSVDGARYGTAGSGGQGAGSRVVYPSKYYYSYSINTHTYSYTLTLRASTVRLLLRLRVTPVGATATTSTQYTVTTTRDCIKLRRALSWHFVIRDAGGPQRAGGSTSGGNTQHFQTGARDGTYERSGNGKGSSRGANYVQRSGRG